MNNTKRTAIISFIAAFLIVFLMLVLIDPAEEPPIQTLSISKLMPVTSHYDEDHGVMCYWLTRTQTLSCVKVK